MFGHWLPVADRQRLDPEFALRRVAALRSVLARMPLQGRMAILHGLLRPDAVLVGGYTATGRRCCPLSSAVWEATSHQARQWDEIMQGISDLGLGPTHHPFVQAFDDWAALDGNSQSDRDGLIILTRNARGKLISLIEQVGSGAILL